MNNPITCYVVEDQPHAVRVLQEYIERTPGLLLIGAEADPVKAWQLIGEMNPKPDLAFVDIDMKGLSGMELARLLKDQTLIIFSTGYDEYAVPAIDEDIMMDFLLKPYNYERFLQAVDKARRKLQSEQNKQAPLPFLMLQTGGKGKYIFPVVKDILYIEALHNYIRILLTKENHIVNMQLMDIEPMLPMDQFIRVHRSFIVNLNKIKSVDGNVIQLEGDKEIGLGRSYRDGFFERLQHLRSGLD